MMRAPTDYREWFWFHDMVKLYEDINFGWFRCKHDPLPSKRNKEAWEEIDLYFLEQMKLEAKGWQSISLGNFSDYEHLAISAFVEEFPKHAHLQHITPGNDIFPIIGPIFNPSTVVTVHQKLLDRLEVILESFARPNLIVTTQEITPVIRNLLPVNHRIIVGEAATAVSYDLVSAAAGAEIAALHENRLRQRN